MFDITENAKLVPIQYAIDRTTNAMTTEWISMKNATKATFILDQGAISSASSIAVTLAVATDKDGTNAKTITSASADTTLGLDHYYTNSGDTYTKTSVSSSTFNLDSHASTLVVIEVLAAEMGTLTSTSVDYDADYVRLSVAASGANAVGGAMCLLTGLRYQQDTPPSAIT